MEATLPKLVSALQAGGCRRRPRDLDAFAGELGLTLKFMTARHSFFISEVCICRFVEHSLNHLQRMPV